jgi:hypothetical protein
MLVEFQIYYSVQKDLYFIEIIKNKSSVVKKEIVKERAEDIISKYSLQKFTLYDDDLIWL